MQYRDLTTALYRQFIEPRRKTIDDRRRELVLNTLLSGLLVIATIILLFVAFSYFVTNAITHIDYVWQIGIFWALLAALLYLSRKGKVIVASFIYIGQLLVSGMYFAFAYGLSLAQAQLVLALTVVVAGVLFSAPLALVASAVVSIALGLLAFVQINGHHQPLVYWQDQPFTYGDVIGFIVIFLIIGLVSWLSNRELDRALQRARKGEIALQKERDSLEEKVTERTRELEDLQLVRLLELQPFAEFGRIGASLVHEIANPLTAATMQLEALDREQHSDLVLQVQRNLQQLERYLLAARKQLKRESRLTSFAVGPEIRQVINLSRNKANRANVRIESEIAASMKLYGDPVKFSQLIANLLANAIDASENDLPKPAIVSLQASQQGSYVTLSVVDHGVGISKQTLEHLFEPFYSTKKSVRGGLGIGLTMVKQYAERDFRGSITVSSSPAVGTVFTVRLRNQTKL